MKKILISLLLIGVISAVVGGGIHAIFSDTEAATGNSFTSGTLNMQVGGTDPCTVKLTFNNVKPTDTGTGATWLITNLGSINGTLNITLSAITNNENVVNNVEIAAGESSINTVGDLGQLLKMAFWMDVDKNGTWSSGDYYLLSNGTKVLWASGSTLPTAAYDYLNNFGTKSWTNVQTINGTADAGNLHVEYNFPNNGGGVPGNLADNRAQSDSCVFDITFVLNQQ